MSPEREDVDEEQEALAFAKRTHKAHEIALNKLETVIRKKKRSAGKAPSVQQEEGRPAVG